MVKERADEEESDCFRVGTFELFEADIPSGVYGLFVIFGLVDEFLVVLQYFTAIGDEHVQVLLECTCLVDLKISSGLNNPESEEIKFLFSL